MHNKQFYLGVRDQLRELDKLAQLAPAASPVIPSAPNPTPVSVQQANTKPIDANVPNNGVRQFGITANPQTIGVVSRVNANPGAYAPYFKHIANKAEGYKGNGIPDANYFKDGMGGVVANDVWNRTKIFAKDIFSNPANLVGPVYGYNSIKSLVNNAKELNDVRTTFGTLSEQSPTQQLQAFNEVGNINPDVHSYLKEVLPGQVGATAENMPWVDKAMSVFNPPKKDSIQGAILNDPGLRAAANKGALGDTLGGAFGWLQQNWGKLALGVGGVTALTMLLKNIMSNNQAQQPNQQFSQRNAGPRFI